jgi:hypothetical protein
MHERGRVAFALMTVVLVGSCSSGSNSASSTPVDTLPARVALTTTNGPAVVATTSQPTTSTTIAPGVSTTAAAAVTGGCSLLTTTELQAALGGTVDDGTLSTAPATSESICDWIITLGSGDAFSAEVHVYPGSTDSDFTLNRQSAAGPTTVVTGVGDKAYSERVVAGTQVFDDLWVRKGSRVD